MAIQYIQPTEVRIRELSFLFLLVEILPCKNFPKLTLWCA